MKLVGNELVFRICHIFAGWKPAPGGINKSWNNHWKTWFNDNCMQVLDWKTSWKGFWSAATYPWSQNIAPLMRIYSFYTLLNIVRCPVLFLPSAGFVNQKEEKKKRVPSDPRCSGRNRRSQMVPNVRSTSIAGQMSYEGCSVPNPDSGVCMMCFSGSSSTDVVSISANLDWASYTQRRG